MVSRTTWMGLLARHMWKVIFILMNVKRSILIVGRTLSEKGIQDSIKWRKLAKHEQTFIPSLVLDYMGRPSCFKRCSPDFTVDYPLNCERKETLLPLSQFGILSQQQAKKLRQLPRRSFISQRQARQLTSSATAASGCKEVTDGARR